MRASLRLFAITLPCALLLTPPGSAQVVQRSGSRLAQLAEVAWREGEAKPLPVATAEAFGYGTERLSYRVLTVKTSEADRHEVLVIALGDGTHVLHLARRLPNDIWMIRTSLSGSTPGASTAPTPRALSSRWRPSRDSRCWIVKRPSGSSGWADTPHTGTAPREPLSPPGRAADMITAR